MKEETTWPTRSDSLQRQINDAEECLEETRQDVEKGWVRKSRLREIEEHLEGLRKLLREAEG